MAGRRHENRINTVKMRSLRSKCDVKMYDRVRNVVTRKRYGLKEDVVTRIERACFDDLAIERMDDKKLTKGIYKANVCGSV